MGASLNTSQVGERLVARIEDARLRKAG